jgi:tetratricopeptide (TPR) repeat protein
MGAAPHNFPAALPLADLRFCTGWYLFEGEYFEFSALAYEESGDIYSALGRWDELAESYNNSGAAMVQVDRPLTAASVLRKAVDIREELGDVAPLAVSRYNLARALADAGQRSAAISGYSQAAADYQTTGQTLDSLEALGATLELLAGGGEAARFELQGKAILGRLDSAAASRERDELVGNTWFELAAGRYLLKDYEGAVAAFRRSLRSWEALEMPAEQGQTHYSLAGPHLAMHLFGEAYADLVRALALAVELSDSVSIIAISEQLKDVDRLIRSAGQELPLIPKELRAVLERMPRD